MKQPTCIATGEKVRYGNIFASVDAERAYREKVDALAAELQEKGFVRVESTPNLFIKDGRAITLEAYSRDPMGTLDRHAALG